MTNRTIFCGRARSVCTGLGTAACMSALAPCSAQVFRPVGTLVGATYSYVQGLSGDGQVAVGLSDHAFRWTAAGGMQDLGVLPSGLSSQAWSANADGSTIAGDSDAQPFQHAFGWSPSGGMTDLAPSGMASYARAISADGSTIVGFTVNTVGRRHAFRWRADTGLVDLGTLTTGGISFAAAVSGDGAVVVGTAGTRAFRWTAEAGMIDLGTAGGGFVSSAAAISRDGSVIVGNASTAQSSSAVFRWTAASGIVPVVEVGDGDAFTVHAVNGDGSIIVGGGIYGARMWKNGVGLIDIPAALAAAGENLIGWQLTHATGISTDGRMIAGYGTHNGRTEGWVAMLPGACVADFNHSGDVGLQDILDFLSAYFDAALTADINGSGAVSVQDVFDFLAAYFAGCP